MAKVATRKEEAKFTPRGTVKLSDTTSLAVSNVEKGGKLVGYSISKLINTAKFKGYTNGMLVPVANVREFLKLFPNGKNGKS